MKNSWTPLRISECENETGFTLTKDEASLAAFSHDFGKIASSKPKAIAKPKKVEELQRLLAYAHEKGLNLTLRGSGLSQAGQSLSANQGLILTLADLDQTHVPKDIGMEDTLWVPAHASWAQAIELSLKANKIPLVIPYNCNLSLAGVISAGGIGASSFKYGPVTAEIHGLEVVNAEGKLLTLDKNSPLFHACLGGQGCFAVITRACLRLRTCKKRVRTFFLSYQEPESFFQDLETAKGLADHLECFSTPAIQGAKLNSMGRSPFALWLFGMHLSLEYDETPPDLKSLGLKPWKHLHTQDENIESYLHRHDPRFESMKKNGLWDLPHLWYECFVPASLLTRHLDEILQKLPLHYANIVQIVPIAPKTPRGFFILPQGEDIYALMILNPGLAPSSLPLVKDCIKELDARLLSQGGKRYLSGFLSDRLEKDYWTHHFGQEYKNWVDMKKRFDPKGVFSSLLHPSAALL